MKAETECHMARRGLSKVSINEQSEFRKAFVKFEFGEAPMAVKWEKKL